MQDDVGTGKIGALHAAATFKAHSCATPSTESAYNSGPLLSRQFSSYSNISIVELEHSSFIPQTGNQTDGALVILHGLFGSKRNFATLSKAIAKDLNIPVYALDLRNQGDSPHAAPMSYSAMAADVLHFIRSRSLRDVTLLGHSMGGKVAMSVALHPSLTEQEDKDILSKLVVVDVAPTKHVLPTKFQEYAEGMKKIESLNLRTKKEALEYLQSYEPDTIVREFLLTNLKPSTLQEPFVRFRIPLDLLVDSIALEISSFPYDPGERSWNGSTLFIKGLHSDFITRSSLPAMEKFFPNMFLRTLDADHWVHGDRPKEFKELVQSFIKTGSSFAKHEDRYNWSV